MPMTSNIEVSKMSFKNRSWPQRQNAASCCFYKTLYSVATRLRYDVTFSDSVVTNFLPILTVNKFRKSLSPIFNEVKHIKMVSLLAHRVSCVSAAASAARLTFFHPLHAAACYRCLSLSSARSCFCCLIMMMMTTSYVIKHMHLSDASAIYPLLLYSFDLVL